MVWLNVDKDGYLRGLRYGPGPGEGQEELPHVESLDGLDMRGVRMMAYRWDGERLVLDEERLAALESKQRAATRIAQLKAKLDETDYIAAKLAEGAATREEYADVLARRQAWRDEINRLSGGDDNGG